MLEQLLVSKTLRVPAPTGTPGDGAALSRSFDAALMSVGFKASGELLRHLAGLDPDQGLDTVAGALAAVRHLVGDHVEHNAYFKDFPRNVPDTVEFWLELMMKSYAELIDFESLDVELSLETVNLLDLPGYGKYQHSYEEMLAAHAAFIPALSDRVTVLHLGGTLDEEAEAVYRDLATSRTPLSASDLELLGLLAAWCADHEQPETIPVRENRAVINRVRLAHGKPLLLIDTLTDVLRLAAALSGGDVTLEQSTRFVSLARRDRRTLLATLDQIVAADAAKLADVSTRAEAWKRLGERLHPHEFRDRYPHAADVFAVARGELTARSLAARVEARFAADDVPGALRELAVAPGMLLRTVDRVLSLAPDQADVVSAEVARAAAKSSGRVLLSLREHLDNRANPFVSPEEQSRIFVGRSGHAWVTPETREPLPAEAVAALTAILDREISARLPEVGHLVVDPAVYNAAIPLSGKATAAGLGIMPRGSRTSVDGERLRFFIHWQERERTTDFDLSALLLDRDFEFAGQLSYTRLNGNGAVHSGDVTQAPAPDGASEFIEFDLGTVTAAYIVPQVNIYSGEGYDEVAESFFGYMEMGAEQQGNPFEPRAVRMKAEVRGNGRVALPLVFERDDSGRYHAVWMNLTVTGAEWGNRVERHRLSTSDLVRSLVHRHYLRMSYLVDAMRPRAAAFTEWSEGAEYEGPLTFIGLTRPEGLPEGSDVYTLDRWNQLVPE